MRPLTTVSVLALMTSALDIQVSLAPIAHQAITHAGGYQQYGHGSVDVGYDTSFDIVWRGMLRSISRRCRRVRASTRPSCG